MILFRLNGFLCVFDVRLFHVLWFGDGDGDMWIFVSLLLLSLLV